MRFDNKYIPAAMKTALTTPGVDLTPVGGRPASPEMYGYLRGAIAQIRWATLGALLIITLLFPTSGTVTIPAWVLVALFAAYNLLIGLMRNRPSALRPFAVVAMLDLVVGGLLYLLAADFGGPLFILFFFAVDSATATLTLRGTLLYTAAVAVVAVIYDLIILHWQPGMAEWRSIATRLVILALVAAGMAVLTQRLEMEHRVARSSADEAMRLESLDRLRADFLTSMSHELRTPLTAARAAFRLIETSATERLRPDERRLVENGLRNTERLSLLIDDLFALNQLTAGTVRLAVEPIDLREIVAQAVEAVMPLVREKGQTLALHLPTPLHNQGDAWRLEQVLTNLLANAHYHSPGGTHIAVIGRATATEIQLTISDNGPGIALEEQQAIFQRFYRVRSTTSTSDGGSGLGLAIAKGLIELHQGRILVQSSPGHGATFHIVLPLL